MPEQVKERIILPEKYYHTYFTDLIRFVRKHSQHLLGPPEEEFIRGFEKLSEDAQCMYIRFFNRKGPYFRLDKINYPEIDHESAVRELLDNKFITSDFGPDARLLRLFTRSELIQLFDDGFDLKKLRKDELLSWIAALDFHPVLLEPYEVIKVDKEDQVEFLKLLYFGRYRGRMTDFVVRDVGNITLEKLDESQFRPWFETRDEALALFRMSKLAGLVRRSLKSAMAREVIPALSGLDLRYFQQFRGSRRVLERMCHELGMQLEREGLPERALDFYKLATKPPARERQIRIYDQLGDRPKARRIAEEILEDYGNASELTFAKDFLARPRVRINRSTTGKIKEADVLTLTPKEGLNVEALVLEHFTGQGYKGIHAENFLWRSLFGLFYWEELFDQSSGTFHNPLQSVPSDFFDPDFYETRKDALVAKTSAFSSKAKFLEKLLITYQEKNGISNAMVYWFEDMPEVLKKVVKLIPIRSLHRVLLEMSRNLRDNTVGFPDLFVWKSNEYHFYEVKSPNDHLSSQQLFWIDFLTDCGINASILRIRY